MGWLSDTFEDIGDTFSDVGDTVGAAVNSTINAGQDVAKYAIDTVGKTGQGLHDNIDNYWKAARDLSENGMTAGIDTLYSIAQDPTDINSYTDPIREHLRAFDDTGNELFGTGGWAKPTLNYFSTGNPFYGAGDLAFQADAAIEGKRYSGGTTAPISSAYSIYNMGSNIADTINSPSVPPGGTPLDNTNLNSNYDVPNYADGMDIGNYDYGQPPGLESVSGGYNIPDTGPMYQPGLLDQASSFLNSGAGRATTGIAKALNPTLGTVLGGATTALNGDFGKAAVDTLGSLYLNNKQAQAGRAYQRQINEQIARMNSLYSNDSAYANQLRQELERKDAASGRRSQYGGRATELQARLAEKGAGLSQVQGLLTSQANQFAMQQQQQARSKQFNALASIFTPSKPSTPAAKPENTGPSPFQQGWDSVKELWGSF